MCIFNLITTINNLVITVKQRGNVRSYKSKECQKCLPKTEVCLCYMWFWQDWIKCYWINVLNLGQYLKPTHFNVLIVSYPKQMTAWHIFTGEQINLNKTLVECGPSMDAILLNKVYNQDYPCIGNILVLLEVNLNYLSYHLYINILDFFLFVYF